MDQMELAGKDPSERLPLGVKSVFDFSAAHQDLKTLPGVEQVDDFGRESLGIINLNHPDFGRDSLSFLHDPVQDVGRESLGIINLNELHAGRDSLGFTHIKTSDFITLNVPQISLIESLENGDETSMNTPLNNAFLMPSKASLGSSISSISPSFHSASLNSFPSRIYSASSSSRSDLLNEAFVDAAEFFTRLQTSVRLSRSAAEQKRVTNTEHRRIKSLPDSNPTVLSSCPEEDDLVFLQDKSVASANRSVFDIEIDEANMLDATKEPEDFHDVSHEEEPARVDTATAFTAVDKLFSPPLPEVLTLSESLNTAPPLNCDSKEAVDMLHTLSEILNSENPTEKQKSEGQTLIDTLTELIVSGTSSKSRSNSLDDSGHSSIESEAATSHNIERYEVLDLRVKSSGSLKEEEPDNCAPLDLSMKSKSASSDKTFASPKILPRKFNKSHQKSITDNRSLGSNCSLSSNDSGNLAPKFRLKKTDEKSSSGRKGPLKAMIPVDSMSRRKSFEVKKPRCTPPRPPSNLPHYKLKKTSTPINESSLKPMAQSTPDTPKVTAANKFANSFDSSPKLMKHKLSYSGSSLNQSQDSKNKTASFTKKPFGGDAKPLMRRSFGDLRKTQASEKVLVRSNSMGASSALAATLRKVNARVSGIGKSTLSNSKTEKVPVLKENKIRGPVRVSLVKKSGKEN